MLSDEEIDLALMANITQEWRKLSLVIGSTMLEIAAKDRMGLDDLYFSGRVSALVEKGRVEHKGDLDQMRKCEVRLSS
jgi:hypothetical protein